MSKLRMLRCLVNERLTAAAEEIFALFERTIVEYEEEVCRCKEENKRKQQLPDSGVQIHLMSAGPSLNQEITEPQIKEDLEKQRIKQEEEQLQEFAAVSVKSEEQSSLFQEIQSEDIEETQGEECGGAEADLDPHGHLHLQTEEHTDDDEDWECPASCSTQQMETEADGKDYNQVTSVQNLNPISHFKSLPETCDTVKDGDISGSDVAFKIDQNKCPFCRKICRTKQDLQTHTRVHTGEKPYTCSICEKTFTQMGHLKTHMRIHTGEKPYSCSICSKAFSRNSHLVQHVRTHTGEKPYSCSICNKTFNQSIALKTHMRIHTGEKPFSCPVCNITFTNKGSINWHMKLHTGERP